jgi:glucose-1-phosphate adenylyltransferase
VHDNCEIQNSIIRREAVIEEDVVLEDCIVMDYVRVCQGSRLRRVIIDRHNIIEAGSIIGHDRETDAKRFTVSSGGVTVIPSGQPSIFARSSAGSRSYSE